MLVFKTNISILAQSATTIISCCFFKHTLFSCYRFCLYEKKRWISFPPSWKGPEPNSANDVRCVPLWSSAVCWSLVYTRKLCTLTLFSEISSFLHFERTNLIRINSTSGTHLTSLASSAQVLPKMAEMKLLLSINQSINLLSIVNTIFKSFSDLQLVKTILRQVTWLQIQLK